MLETSTFTEIVNGNTYQCHAVLGANEQGWLAVIITLTNLGEEVGRVRIEVVPSDLKSLIYALHLLGEELLRAGVTQFKKQSLAGSAIKDAAVIHRVPLDTNAL